MLDKNIVDRMVACYKKAKKIVRGRRYQSDELIHDLAIALFKEGYKGIRLDLEQDITVLKDKRGYIRAGHPGFMGLFGRDSLIVAWQLLDYDPMIARNTLLNLAKLQGIKTDKTTGEEPGKILHEYYPGQKHYPATKEENDCEKWFKKYKSDIKWLELGKPVYYSVDSTPLFLIVLEEFYKKTGDKNLYSLLRDATDAATQWIYERGIGKKDIFIKYKKSKALSNQSWKDSDSYNIKYPVAMVEVQGYAYAATKDDELKNNFYEHFWMPDEEYYAFAVDGSGNQVKEITSNPGHLLFTDILMDETEQAIVKKLFSDELWTPYGIRTHSTESEIYDPFSYHLGSIWPHDNWIIAQGLKKCGYKKEYQLVKNALFKAYDTLGHLPEYYGVVNNKIVKLPANYPQAWASGALLNFVLEDEK